MIRAALVVLAAVALAEGASAQVVKQGNVSGTLVSANAAAPSGGTDAVLLTAPATGKLVLTQLCIAGTPGSNNEDNAQVVGSTIGRIAFSYSDELGTCTTFTPGLAVPPGEELRCAQAGASGSPVHCTVTGIVTKK